MGKLISWVAVLLLLVVVPIGSWVYLNKGLNYRKAALAELIPKDSISANLDTLDLLKGKVSLIILENSKTAEIVKALEDQFNNSQGFQIIYKDSMVGNSFLPNSYLGDFFNKEDDFSFALLDERMRVRNYYKNDIESVRKMVEHIAIVIPRPKETDIVQKNNK
ncbi:MAG: hypothetical protein IPN86_09890 [Saprospiraceae bacterium]|nr:hypothetical protein [Saprospiraceae bacterium]